MMGATTPGSNPAAVATAGANNTNATTAGSATSAAGTTDSTNTTSTTNPSTIPPAAGTAQNDIYSSFAQQFAQALAQNQTASNYTCAEIFAASPTKSNLVTNPN